MRIIPRAIYYLHPVRSLRSMINVIFSKNLERKSSVSNFEMSFSKHVGQASGYATSHARVALYGILKSLSLSNNTEVIMTPINLPDMANATTMNNLVPRYCDYLPNSIEPDYEKCSRLITSKTKIFLYTHLYGVSPDMEKLSLFCREHNLILIQDCTQSVGVYFKDIHITTFADINFYSLCDLKLIHTHRGGIVTSNNKELFSKVVLELEKIKKRPLKAYFMRFIFEDLVFSFLLRRNVYLLLVWPYLKYLYANNKQDEAVAATRGEGINFFGIKIFKNLFGCDGNILRKSFPNQLLYEFTDLQGEMGIESLSKIEKIDKKRIENTLLFISYLDSKIKNNFLLKYDPKNLNTFWKIPIITSDIKSLQRFLFINNIDSAPINLPVINSLDNFKNNDSTQNAQILRNYGLCIPCHHYLNKSEIKQMADCINKYFEARCG